MSCVPNPIHLIFYAFYICYRDSFIIQLLYELLLYIIQVIREVQTQFDEWQQKQDWYHTGRITLIQYQNMLMFNNIIISLLNCRFKGYECFGYVSSSSQTHGYSYSA